MNPPLDAPRARRVSTTTVEGVGRNGGRVRPPLADLTESELAELTTLVNKIS